MRSMKEMSIRVILLVAISFGLGAEAQEKRVLDVQEAIAIAMKNNVEVISSQNDFNKASADILPKVWGNNLPTVNAQGGYTRTLMSPGTAGFSGGSQSNNSYNYGLSANYVLFDGFKKFSEMSQARLVESSARFDLENTRQDVALQVFQAYVEVLKSKQLLRVGEENVKRSEEQLKRLEERNRLGAQILSDVYKQKVQVGTDKLALNRAKNNLNTSKAALNSLIGLDVNTEIELKELESGVSYTGTDYNFDAAIQEALAGRRDYQAAQKRLESARRTLSVAKSGYYPTVSASAEYSWNGNQLSHFSKQDGMNAGITVSVPLFNGFQTSAGVIQADQSVQTAKSNLDGIRRKVALDVKVSILNLQTADENVKLSEENLKSAKEDLRLATERYNVGAGTILDQITATTNYSNAEAGLIQATYDYLFARQQYLLAIGRVEVP